MPFITKEKREAIENRTLKDWQPGDWCYIHYKDMVDKWKTNPRWTTAHNIYKEIMYSPLMQTEDEEAGKQLAWQVFFIKYVMPYEDLKEELNGTI